MQKTLLALGGDGIGPEILKQGLRVADQLARMAGIRSRDVPTAMSVANMTLRNLIDIQGRPV